MHPTLRRMVRRKRWQKNWKEFAKEIHFTSFEKEILERRGKEIQNEIKRAFCFHCQNQWWWWQWWRWWQCRQWWWWWFVITFYIDSFNKAKKEEEHSWKASLRHLNKIRLLFLWYVSYLWYFIFVIFAPSEQSLVIIFCYICDICYNHGNMEGYFNRRSDFSLFSNQVFEICVFVCHPKE